MASILCGKCHNKHYSVAQVRACYSGLSYGVAVAAPPAPPKPITDKQMKFIKDLGGDLSKAYRMTVQQASGYITELKRNRGSVNASGDPTVTAPNRTTTKVPLAMLQMVPSGLYAVRPDSNTPYTFFRVSRPKSGKFGGALKIQTQHGEKYELMMAVWPSGSVSIYDKRWEDELLLVVVDPNGAGIAYGQEIGHCMRCGKDLTDNRSRWYGIGPECEKSNRQIIDLVDATKGAFTFGA